MIDVLGIGTPFVDYFFEVSEKTLKKYNLKPEDDFLFEEKNINFQKITKEFPLLHKCSGGNCANTIIALNCLGIKTGYYGVIGKDKDGEFWLKNIGNIDKSIIIRKGTMSICACLLSHDRKYRTFLSTVNPYDIDFLSKVDFKFLNNAKYIHISPIFGKNFRQSFVRLEEIVQNIIKAQISFSPGILYVSLGLKTLLPILNKTKVLFLNVGEMKVLTGKSVYAGGKYLLNFGPEIIVCTVGEKGVFIISKKEQIRLKAYKVNKVIDTTGAGDVFAAGILYGLLLNKKLIWSARFANKIASQSLSDFGLNSLIRNQEFFN